MTEQNADYAPDLEDSCPECGAGPDQWCNEFCDCAACARDNDQRAQIDRSGA